MWDANGEAVRLTIRRKPYGAGSTRVWIADGVYSHGRRLLASLSIGFRNEEKLLHTLSQSVKRFG